MSIKFGPAGLGPVKEAVERLNYYHKLGLKACEIAFTYGVYIKEKQDAIKIGEEAKKFGIELSIHAPYWINLNSTDKSKIAKSKERILRCLEVGTYLKAHRVVFHAGYYGKMDKQETYNNIKNQILELQKIRKQKGFTPELAPETTGKINVFGSTKEIAQLVRDTKCSFTIDFAHILAREKEYNFKATLELFKSKQMHIHFSGINYTEKGERSHKATPESELKKLLSALPKNKEITLINESPDPIKDSLKGLKLHKA